MKRRSDNRPKSEADPMFGSARKWGDAMGNRTLRVLVIYLVLLIAGQAAAVGVGLLLDPVSKTAALAGASVLVRRLTRRALGET